MANGDDDALRTNKIDRALIYDIHNEGIAFANRTATERGEIGSRLKGLQESHGLNLKAFKMASQIRKMPNGKREHTFRALLEYCELLDVNQQKDIEDHIREQHQGSDTRTDLEAALDGQPREANSLKERQETAEDGSLIGSRMNVDYTPNSDMGRHTLAAFKTTLDEALTHEAVNTGLEKFSADHPKLADEALMIAKNRTAAIDRANNGGEEDVRSTTAREQAAASTKQAAEAGKAEGKARRKAAGKTKANGAGSPAVH